MVGLVTRLHFPKGGTQSQMTPCAFGKSYAKGNPLEDFTVPQAGVIIYTQELFLSIERFCLKCLDFKSSTPLIPQ